MITKQGDYEEEGKKKREEIKKLELKLKKMEEKEIPYEDVQSDQEFREQKEFRRGIKNLEEEIKNKKGHLHKHTWREIPEIIKIFPVSTFECMGCGRQFVKGMRGIKIRREK